MNVRFGLATVLLLVAVACDTDEARRKHEGEPVSGAKAPVEASEPPSEPAPPAARLRGADGGRSNVLLLTIDTLRMDHLGAYGYRLPTSPRIDALARESVLFTDAITPVPTTAPALASLLTGEHVDKHHVRMNAGTFPDEVGSMAEAFRAAGYETAGFYGNEAIEAFGRGFDVWEVFPRRQLERGLVVADDLGTTRALEWLETAKEPWFLWLHLIDPHGPYDSSPPERSADFDYPDDPALDQELPRSDKNEVRGALPRFQYLPDATRVGDYVRRYDGEIVGADLQVARVLDFLESRSELDRTLLVLTADHGESLTEDEYYFQHGRVLNEVSLRIPLILRHADLPSGLEVDAPVSLVDLYPTVAALIGLAVPDVSGEDISPAIFGEATDGDRLRLTYTVTPNLHVAIMRGSWRLRGKPLKKGKGMDISRFRQLELFDTSEYPERRVSPKEHPEAMRALRKELKEASIRVRSYEMAPVELTREQEHRLRALGYME